MATEPESIAANFDGKKLAVADPRRIELPRHDPEKLHFFRAELDFSRNVTTVLEAVLGGTYADELAVDLTAVPVMLAPGAKLPAAAKLQGRLLKDGRPLTVVAAEEGPAEIVVVRDEGVRQILNRLGRTSERTLRRHARGLKGSAVESLRFKTSLPRDHQIRFLWPFSERQGQARLDFDLLTPSQAFTSRDGGLYWLLTEFSPPAGGRPGEQRLADAVAVAGLLAAGRNRRRAVVLVAGAGASDASRYAPSSVQRYLRRLSVPLFVWSPEEGAGQLARRWGAVAEVSTMRKLEQAVKELKRRLGRQRIVWVAGVHLPEKIELAPRADGLSLVR